MKPSRISPLITSEPAQRDTTDGRPIFGLHLDESDVQVDPSTFYTALGLLLQSAVDRGTKGIMHPWVFSQAAYLLQHPEDPVEIGVCLEVNNNSMWFMLDLRHHGEDFYLEIADDHAPCGGYSLQIPENPVLSPCLAAFILFHIATILGDPTVKQGWTITN